VADEAKAGSSGVPDDLLGVDTVFECRSGTQAVALEIDHPDAPVRLQGRRDVAEQRVGVVELVIRVDDEHGVEGAGRQARSSAVPSTRLTLTRPSRATRRMVASSICGWMSSA